MPKATFTVRWVTAAPADARDVSALSLADARQQAMAARHAVAQGNDPAAYKQGLRTAPTVAALAMHYLEFYAKVHKKSWRDDARLLAKEVLPQWGTRKAYDIRRRDVIALLDHLVERGAPIQANRVLALVRKVFHWAISRELVEVNPCLQVKAPSKEQFRNLKYTGDVATHVLPRCGVTL